MYKDQIKTPYYAVIFTSIQTENISGYAEMASQMELLAQRQSGYLGMDSARDGVGITVSYWESLEAISLWKNQLDHLSAQQEGQQKWYEQYSVRVCEVQRSYDFKNRSN